MEGVIIPIIDDTAGIINDPVILRLRGSMVDFNCRLDVILFAKGLAIGNKFDVKIFEPNVDIMAIKVKSFGLMEKVLERKLRI